MFGWLREGRDEAAVRAAGWAGVMCLPRLLVPRGDGRLGMQPVPELRILRGQQTSLRDVSLVSPRHLDVSGGALEIVAEIVPGTAAQVGMPARVALLPRVGRDLVFFVSREPGLLFLSKPSHSRNLRHCG